MNSKFSENLENALNLASINQADEQSKKMSDLIKEIKEKNRDVVGFDDYQDYESHYDETKTKAEKAFNELFDLGMSVEAKNAAPFLDAAMKALELYNLAGDQKQRLRQDMTKIKLNLDELALKKRKMDLEERKFDRTYVDAEVTESNTSSSGSREDMLIKMKALMQEAKQ